MVTAGYPRSANCRSRRALPYPNGGQRERLTAHKAYASAGNRAHLRRRRIRATIPEK